MSVVSMDESNPFGFKFGMHHQISPAISYQCLFSPCFPSERDSFVMTLPPLQIAIGDSAALASSKVILFPQKFIDYELSFDWVSRLKKVLANRTLDKDFRTFRRSKHLKCEMFFSKDH